MNTDHEWLLLFSLLTISIFTYLGCTADTSLARLKVKAELTSDCFEQGYSPSECDELFS